MQDQNVKINMTCLNRLKRFLFRMQVIMELLDVISANWSNYKKLNITCIVICVSLIFVNIVIPEKFLLKIISDFYEVIKKEDKLSVIYYI